MKCFELIATFIYKGQLPLLKRHLSSDLQNFILDELNSAYCMTEDSLFAKKINKKFSASIKKILGSTEEYEKLINYRQASNFNNEKLFSSVDKGIYKPHLYRYALETLLAWITKINANESI